MKKQLIAGAVMVTAIFVSLPCIAQDMASTERRGCAIEGTWYGANSAALNSIFRIEKNAAGGPAAGLSAQPGGPNGLTSPSPELGSRPV
jgi:hypothetical protein